MSKFQFKVMTFDSIQTDLLTELIWTLSVIT